MTEKDIAKAKAHFEYGIKCDMFNEPVLSYANTVIEVIDAYETLKAHEEKEHQYCKNVCEPKYKAEIERLKTAFENSQKTSKYWKNKCDEAIKEYMKILKGKLALNTDISNFEYQSIIFDMEQGYKELVGEE